MWVPRWSFDYGPVKIVNQVAKADIKHIFVQVYANGKTIYPSAVLQSDRRFTRGRDPLRTIIKEAHKRGIKVHAWLNVFYVWGYSARPIDADHPLNANWELYDKDGHSIKDFSPVQLKRMGFEGYFLSPFNRSYQKLMLSIIDELLNNYDVDGIHLDYIRYPDLDFAYDPWARTSFARRFYLDPTRPATFAPIIGDRGINHLQALYRRMLISHLTDYVRTITKFVHKKKQIEVSAAVKPNPAEARNRFGQDWINWLTDGAVDFVIIMSYTPSTNWILKTVKGLSNQDRIWIGVGTYLQDRKSITHQVNSLRRHGHEDLVIFSFEDLRKRSWLPSCWR